MLIIGFILSGTITSCGQEQGSLQLVYGDTLLKQGTRYSSEEFYNKSDSVLRRAKSIFEEQENWKKWYICIGWLDRNAKKRKQFRQWIDSLTLFETRVPETEDYISYQLAFKKGKCYSELGEHFFTVKYYQEADIGFQSLYEDDRYNSDIFLRKLISANSNGLAITLSRMGDNLSAIRYSQKALNIAIELKDTSKYLKQLGLIGKYNFHQGNNDEAIRRYKFALSEGANEGVIYPYLADVYLSMDSLDLAEEYLTSDLNYDEYPDLEIALATLYESKNNQKKAIESRIRAIDIMLKDPDYSSRSIMKEYTNYALMQNRFGDEDEVIKYVQKVLMLKYPESSFSDFYSRPPFQDNFPDLWVLKTFWLKASYFNSKYKKLNDSKDLEEATFYYDLLFIYFEKMKLQYYSTNSKYQMGEYGQQIYTEALDFYLQLSQEAENGKYSEKALSLTQRANSFVLKNEVGFRRGMQLANVETDKIEKYLRLASLASNGESTNNNDPIADFEKFNTQLLKEYPALANYQNENSISIGEIQTVIDSQSLLVKYHYFENQLYRFMVSKENLMTDVIPLDSTSQRLITEILAFNSGSVAWNESDYRINSKTVYDLILGDRLNDNAFQNKTHLIIVPDGPLKNLAFNSLVTRESNESLSAEDYLINSHAVSYLFYCSQLNFNNESLGFKGDFVGFGLEYDDAFLQEIIDDYKKSDDLGTNNSNRSFSLRKLKFADDETLNAAKLFGGKSFVNDMANLQNVYKEISNFSMIHFSAHALVDMEDYLESAIIFGKDDKENYRLKYSDILNLNLKTDLVVLSACQTNVGKGVDGEALASLSKAFIQSGCKSTVGAYWEVPDQSTMKVMNLFYTNLKDGMSKSEAMRQAQLSYLNDESISTPRTRMPLHWASWNVYGDNAPVLYQSTRLGKNNALWTMLGVILILAGWMYKKTRKI